MTTFAPSYDVIVCLPTGTYTLGQLASLRSGLSTSLSVGALDLTLADPTREIATFVGEGKNGRLPEVLNAPIFIRCTNVYGVAGTCWGGYVTSAGPGFDGQFGRTVHITAGDGLKPFAIQTQSAQDVASLAIASYANVTASAVLRYAATRAGIPPRKLAINVSADAGSGYQMQPIPLQTWINPNQSTWLSVLNGIATYTGNILFANEKAQIVYRPIRYDARPASVITADQVYSWQALDSDEQIATYVEARYGLIPVMQTAPRETAPQYIRDQLRDRKYITYMPWITNASAAQWAAKTLLRQGMAQLGVGSVTVLGDHAYHVGDTVYLKWIGKDAFIQTVSQEWQWGGLWLTTLGLTFIRDHGALQPTPVTPQKSVLAGLPDPSKQVGTYSTIQSLQMAESGSTPAIATTLSTVTAKPPPGYDVIVPASLLADGTVVTIRDAATHQPITYGTNRRASYTVSASYTATTVSLYDPTHRVTNLLVELLVVTPSLPETSTSSITTQQTASDASTPAKRALTTVRNPAPGSGSRNRIYVPPVAPSMGNVWRDKVVTAAAAHYGDGYWGSGWNFDHTAFSCVALVVYAMRTSGYAAALAAKYPTDRNAQAVAAAAPAFDLGMVANLQGNMAISWDQVQPGDLLFFAGTDGTFSVDGYSHVALAYGQYTGPAISFTTGKTYTLGPTSTAMINAEGWTNGVTFDDYNTAYWISHRAAAFRPDYAL